MSVHTKKNFIPRKVPRYLSCQVDRTVWVADLKAYNKHRLQVWIAEPKVDATPLPMNPLTYVNRNRLRLDAERIKWINKENRTLLRRIILIHRKGGMTNTWNPLGYVRHSKWKAHEKKMLEIQYANKKKFKLINQMKSFYPHQYFEKQWKKMIGLLEYSARCPLLMLQKECVDDKYKYAPSISRDMGKIGERPKAYLEFRVEKGEVLGRIIIELYHDHVPVTVQNFLGLCSGENRHCYRNCVVYRIIRNSHIEAGDVTKNTGRGGFSIYGKRFHEENHVLSHSRRGVVSMCRVGLGKNSSQFFISLRAYESLDMKNVVFGKIIKGMQVLDKMENYGRFIGKPLAKIIISNCGRVQYEET